MNEKTGFHVRVKPLSLIFGFLAGLGYMVLLQQYGLTTLTLGKLALFLLIGLVMGVVLPTLATLIPHKKKAEPKPMETEGGH